MLGWEKETLGLYLSGHPIDRHRRELASLAGTRIAELRPGKRRVAGLIVAVRFMRSRRGRMAVLTLDDSTARMEVTVYNETLEAAQDKVIEDRIVIVEGECSVDEFSGDNALNAQRIWSLDELRQQFARTLVLQVNADASADLVPLLRTLLADHAPGNCGVAIDYARHDVCARVLLADDWRVRPSAQLLEQLESRLGTDAVSIEY